MVDPAWIRRCFDLWLEQETPAARLVHVVANELNQSGTRGFVLGGLVRDAVLSGAHAKPRDIDIAVDVESPTELDSLVRACGLQAVSHTAFGGVRAIADGVAFDLWPLRDTWAFRRQLVRGPIFPNLPRTTSLNIEAVAVELGGTSAVFEAGFVAALSERVIEVNLEPLPSASQVAVRAANLSSRLGFGLGSRVHRLIQDHSEICASARRCPRMLVPGGGRAWPDKKLVELGVVRDLTDSLNSAGVRKVRSVQARVETKPQTPPDVLGRDECGGLIGFEVVELTDQKLIERNIPRSRERYQAMQAAQTAAERLDALTTHSEQVRVWSAADLHHEVERLIQVKDSKPFTIDREPYAERWLVVHTSEPFVDWDEFIDRARSTGFESLRQLDEVYVVRDFDPATASYPWCRVASRCPSLPGRSPHSEFE